MVLQNDALMDEHYDQDFPLFRSFLDDHYMAYTMAYYGEDADAVLNEERSLEQAQREKFRLICERAELNGDEHILNLGCGFGSFETYLFETYPNIRVTSVTSSSVQAEYIRECMADPSHAIDGGGRCRLIQGVFGAEENPVDIDGHFDAVFAIGLFEHINNMHKAFEQIARLLKDDGICYLHLIVSIPEFPQYQDSNNTLIGKYFPGGRIWSHRTMQQQTDFFHLSGSWYLNGMNYWRTLDQWHRRFWSNMEQLYGKILDSEQVRHWNDYFTLCKVVLFAPLDGTIYGNGHYLYRKKK